MEKKNIKLLTLSLTGVVLLSSVVIASQDKQARIIRGNTGLYSLLLDGSQKLTTSSSPSENEISHNVRTANNNSVSLSGFNVVNNNDGWQTLLPNGYIYNPVTSTGTNNKLSGIQSIEYSGDGELELSYGYSLNNQEIIYAISSNLAANTPYFFEESPNYFYIKNSGNSNVNIDSLTINYSCSAQDYPRNNLKVLMIGNSFADDTVFYAERIANSIGINIEMYDAYIGGCTIDKHYENITSENPAYSMRSMNGSSWRYQDNMSLNDIVRYKDWDIITFQQASAEVGRPGKYSNLVNLVNEVKSLVTGNPKYYWHQTWAYDNDYSEYYDYFSYFNNDQVTMFNAIVDCYNNYVVPTGLFEKTIFNGTAVQNIRTSYMGDNFSRDGKHMSHVHGRYTLSSNFLSTILNINLDLTPIQFIPDGMNRSFLKLVNESVRNARNNPGTITNSVLIDEDLARYDLSNYEEIDAGLVGCSFYNCTDSNNFNKRINHTSGTSNKYVTTYRFTQDMLPVGSIVYLREGYGYRPEAWVDDAVQYSRKDETWQNILEIDDSFWDGYQYRSFNIFKSGKLALSDQYVDEQYDEIFDAFHIYVPKDKMTGLTPKSNNNHYDEDQTNFESHGLDIDDYHRIHLDPITGFYKCDELYYLQNKYVDDTAQKFVCTRPFYTNKNDLPVGSIFIIDSGYRWRSDCWKEKATCTRPDNVTTNFYVTDSSFMSPYRRRTFNISSTSSSYIGQNSISFMDHFRIYVPNN